MRPLVLAVVLALLAFADGIAGEVIHHPTLKFSLRAPDGMERKEALERDEVLFTFMRTKDKGEVRVTLVQVTRLYHLVDRSRIQAKDLPAGAKLEWAQWKDFYVQVVRLIETRDTGDYLTFTAQVPLTPEGVQVTVVGDPDDEAELRALMRQMLADLDGETNWTTPGPSYLVYLPCCVIAVFSVGFVVFVVAFFRGLRWWLRRERWRQNAIDVAAAERWWRRHGDEPREYRPESD